MDEAAFIGDKRSTELLIRCLVVLLSGRNTENFARSLVLTVRGWDQVGGYLTMFKETDTDRNERERERIHKFCSQIVLSLHSAFLWQKEPF